MNNLLFTTPSQKSTILKQACWYRGDTSTFDEFTIEIDGEENIINDGFLQRHRLVAMSQLVDSLFPVILDTMILPRVLPTETEINFVF